MLSGSLKAMQLLGITTMAVHFPHIAGISLSEIAIKWISQDLTDN